MFEIAMDAFVQMTLERQRVVLEVFAASVPQHDDVDDACAVWTLDEAFANAVQRVSQER